MSENRGPGKNIETMDGRYFNLADPQPSEVHLGDIATALANQSRFNGFVTQPCSVAAHAALVAWLVLKEGASHELALAALHHDSHEAYVGDITPQMKDLIGRDHLGPIILGIDCAIAEAFDIDVRLFTHPVVKAADELALRLEAREVKSSQGCGVHWGWETPVDPIDGCLIEDELSPELAARLFTETHQIIVDAMKAGR